MALTRDRAQDIVYCAAMLGWDQMLPTMLSMTKAVTQLKPTPDRLMGLASGFWAVVVLQGYLALLSCWGDRLLSVTSITMYTFTM